MSSGRRPAFVGQSPHPAPIGPRECRTGQLLGRARACLFLARATHASPRPRAGQCAGCCSRAAHLPLPRCRQRHRNRLSEIRETVPVNAHTAPPVPRARFVPCARAGPPCSRRRCAIAAAFEQRHFAFRERSRTIEHHERERRHRCRASRAIDPFLLDDLHVLAQPRRVHQRDRRPADLASLGHQIPRRPGHGVTIARSTPTSALNRLDFPTFGPPRSTTCRPPGSRVLAGCRSEARGSDRARPRAPTPLRPTRRSDTPRPENRATPRAERSRSNSRPPIAANRLASASRSTDRTPVAPAPASPRRSGRRPPPPARDRGLPFKYARSVNSPGLREPSARSHRGRDDSLEHDGAAVRRNLHRVLACVGTRRWKERHDDVVERVAADDDVRRAPVAASARSRTAVSVARRARSGSRRANSCPAMSCAARPLILMTPRPARPTGVAMATIVSSVGKSDAHAFLLSALDALGVRSAAPEA